MKIITVCGMGIGTSILLKINAETVLERLGVAAEVEAADIGTAKGAATVADLVLTSEEAVPALAGISAPVRVVDDFMDLDEISAVITEALGLPASPS